MRKLLLASALCALLFSPVEAQIGIPSGGTGGGSGTVTSIATTCGVAGGTITTTGTISGNATPNAQTGTTYAIVDGDCGKLVSLNNAAAVAVSIAQAGTAGSFASGWFATIKNLGAGTVTITPTTSTIDGAVSLALTTNQSIDLYSNGANYITGRGIGGSTSPGGSSGQIQYNNAGAFGGFTMAGDCTLSQPNISCLHPHPGYVTSNWYLGMGPFNYGTTNAATANRIVCYYAYYPRVLTIRNVGVGVVTAGSSNLQIALYTNSGGNPATLIDSTPNIANTGAAAVASGALGANQQVGPGTPNGRDIWHCTNQNDSTVTYRGGIAGVSISQNMFQGSATASNILGSGPSAVTGKLCSGANCNGGSSTFGTWPASLAGTTWTDQTGSAPVPLVAVQVVSSP